jgi:glutathione S-transferase
MRLLRLATLTMARAVTLYTNRMCPFAQRCEVALRFGGVEYEAVEVNLYGSGGFDKTQLKAVEAAGGLSPPKGYIPVLKVGDEAIRESDACVRRIAALAPALEPADAAAADAMITLCNGPLADAGRAVVGSGAKRSPRLDACLGEIDARLAATAYVAGDAFSTADACLLPFLWRIDDSLELPAEFGHLRAYVARACAEPAFAATVVPSWWWWW